jgi:hypothetical protein
MRKLFFAIAIIAIAAVSSSIIFYACQKESKLMSDNAKIDNVKIQKFDDNELLYGIDIAKLSTEACIADFCKGLDVFTDGMSSFTEQDIAYMEELVDLMLFASGVGDLDLFNKYYDEFMRIYYKNEKPDTGKEKFTCFQAVCIKSISQINDLYPEFAKFDESKQIKVLSAASSRYQKRQSQCEDACRVARYNEEAGAGAAFGVGFYACGILSPNPIAAGICIVIAGATYMYAMSQAKTHYNECIEECNKNN